MGARTRQVRSPAFRTTGMRCSRAKPVPEVAAWDDGTDSVPARLGVAATDIVDILTLAARLLKEIPDQQIVHGNGVALTPLRAELTTRQAAEPLQVSGTHSVQLLDEGRLPCRKVGAHRRVRVQDILAHYREIERIVARARDWGRPLHDVRL